MNNLPMLPEGYAWEKITSTEWEVRHSVTGDTVLSCLQPALDACEFAEIYDVAYRRGWRNGYAQCKACYTFPDGEPRPPGH